MSKMKLRLHTVLNYVEEVSLGEGQAGVSRQEAGQVNRD